MKNLFLIGSLLINLPNSTPIKINPRIVNTKLASSLHNGSNARISNKSNGLPPAAFINLGSSTPEPEPVISPIPFAQQIIVLPIIMKLTATILVPCTKIIYEFASLAIENGAAACMRISNNFVKAVSTNMRKFPGKVKNTIKSLDKLCKSTSKNTMKTINSLNNMCTSMSKNTVGALIEFYDNVGKGCVDMASGAKSWGMKSSSFTYNKVLVPFAMNTVDLITQVTEDVTTWFADVTLYAYRYAAMLSQESAHFVTNLSLDVADWVTHYSLLTSQMITNYIIGVIKTVEQTFLDIPVWFAAISAAIIDMTTSLVTSIKDGVIQTYDEFWLMLDRMVDATPFLVRFEEDGQSQISLCPKAQMLLYLISTVYATQQLWEESASEIDHGSAKAIIKSFVSNLQTRFFPPRTLFFAGALARGLQQSSSLKKSFNPTVGVGAIINLGAAALDERWINYIVSGWFISGNMWTLFGSNKPKISSVVEVEKPKGFW